MKYFILAHDVVPESYLQISWDAPGRRWGRFEDAKRFASKDAAVMVADTMFPGCVVVEVSDCALDAATRADLPEWYRERLRQHIANRSQEQHHQRRA